MDFNGTLQKIASLSKMFQMCYQIQENEATSRIGNYLIIDYGNEILPKQLTIKTLSVSIYAIFDNFMNQHNSRSTKDEFNLGKTTSTLIGLGSIPSLKVADC